LREDETGHIFGLFRLSKAAQTICVNAWEVLLVQGRERVRVRLRTLHELRILVQEAIDCLHVRVDGHARHSFPLPRSDTLSMVVKTRRLTATLQ